VRTTLKEDRKKSGGFSGRRAPRGKEVIRLLSGSSAPLGAGGARGEDAGYAVVVPQKGGGERCVNKPHVEEPPGRKEVARLRRRGNLVV